MKNTTCCGNNPVLAMALPRLAVGLFFLFFGLMKIMDPAMFAGMIGNLFGFSGILLTVTVWLVILVELVGGLIILLGNKVPDCLYRLSLLGVLIITIVGFFAAHMGGDAMLKQLLWHGMLALVIGGVLMGKPTCPMGVTGDKTC